MVVLIYSIQKKFKQKSVWLKLLKKNKSIYNFKDFFLPKAIGKWCEKSTDMRWGDHNPHSPSPCTAQAEEVGKSGVKLTLGRRGWWEEGGLGLFFFFRCSQYPTLVSEGIWSGTERLRQWILQPGTGTEGQEEERDTGYTGLCRFNADTMKRSKIKGPEQQIQFLGKKWQDGHCHLLMDVIKKVSTTSPHASKKEIHAFQVPMGFQRKHIPGSACLVNPFYQFLWK